MKNILLLGLLTMTLTYGCIDPPDYPIEPVIEFVSMSHTTVVAQTSPLDANRPVDTLYITFSFTDGDGDLGELGDTNNVYFIDSRFGDRGPSFNIEDIPAAGATNGISGEITAMIPQVFCFPNSEPRDEVVYSIQIADKAGNLSNVIDTPPLELICD